MATARILARSLRRSLVASNIFSPSSLGATSRTLSPGISRLRPSVFAASAHLLPDVRFASAEAQNMDLDLPSPDGESNRPYARREDIMLDGCDFEHWLIMMDKPDGEPTRDEIIDSYIKTLAKIVGSEEEARMKIYSVSTKHYYAFSCLLSEEVAKKLNGLPGVSWVLPDAYVDVRNKDYGGEPFINGQAVPYDPKYHEEWVRNNSRVKGKSASGDRPKGGNRNTNKDPTPGNVNKSDPGTRGGGGRAS